MSVLPNGDGRHRDDVWALPRFDSRGLSHVPRRRVARRASAVHRNVRVGGGQFETDRRTGRRFLSNNPFPTRQGHRRIAWRDRQDAARPRQRVGRSRAGQVERRRRGEAHKKNLRASAGPRAILRARQAPID